MVADILVLAGNLEDLHDWANATEVSVLEIDDTNAEREGDSVLTDELTVTLNESAALTASDSAAITYAKEGQDVNAPRFIMRIINPAFPLEARDIDFQGRIRETWSGQDGRWYGQAYTTEPTPDRSWKATATSYDVNTLLGAKLEDIIPAIKENDAEWIDVNVTDRLGYFNLEEEEGEKQRQARFAKLVDVDVLLQRLLDEAAVGSEVSFTFVPTQLDFKGVPARFSPYQQDGKRARYCYHPASVPGYPPRPFTTYGPTDHLWLWWGGGAYGSMAFAWRNLDPQPEQKGVAWQRFTVAEFFYELAYATGSFVRFKYTSPTEVEVSFYSRRQTYNDATQIKINHALPSPSLDVAPIEIVEDEVHYGASTELIREGIRHYNRLPESPTLQLNPDIAHLDGLPTKGQPLALTVSPTWCNYPARCADGGIDFQDSPISARLPHNCVFWEKVDGTLQRHAHASPGAVPHWREYNTEGIHTGIYVKALGKPDAQGEVGVDGLDTWRPVVAIVAAIDGLWLWFFEMAEYLKYVYRREDALYDGVYDITVPGLCGFKPAVGAGGADWRLAKVGNTVMLDGVEWQIDSVTRGRNDTKLRLMAASATSGFADPGTTPEEEEPPPGTIAPETDPRLGIDPDAPKKNVVPSEKIYQGDMVIVEEGGSVIRARPILEHYGRVRAIALSGWDPDDPEVEQPQSLTVQYSGRVLSSFLPGLVQGQRLWLRDNDDGPNLSTTPLLAVDGDERVWYEVGYAESADVILIDIQEPVIIQG